MTCAYCEEEIKKGERAPSQGADFHRECLFRAVAGSAAHILKECSCFDKHSLGDTDPAHLTKRQAAKLALDVQHQRVLVQYSIFDHPYDMPDKFVVRAFFVWGSAPVAGHARYAESLEEARSIVPRGSYCIPRDPSDPPFLIETWT